MADLRCREHPRVSGLQERGSLPVPPSSPDLRGWRLVDIRVEEVREADDFSLEADKAISDRPADTSYRKDLPAAVEAKLTSRSFLVRPRIQGHSVAWFILDEGVFADKVTAGIIGRKLLSDFKLVVFDYPGKRIGLLR